MNLNESPQKIDRQAGKRTTAGGGLDESLSAGGGQAVTPELPTQFGRYRIVKRLGRGGMGSVYLAEDTQLGRQVALKIPRLAAENRERTIERFQREARAAATLNHPHLCPVHDVGEIDGVPYLTMAFIEGRPLTDYIADGKGLPQPQVAALVRKMALALAEAHAKGIVHRDLKPANIMINQRKEPIVTDFGLAHLDQQEGTRLTQMGMMMGTPTYMAPEQVTGDLTAIGPASDIYSLGVILYEMLTGRAPFEGPVTAVLGQIIAVEPKRPSQHRGDLDPRLEDVCLKAMAKKPGERFASMREMATAIEAFMRSPAGTDKAEKMSPVHAARRPKSTLVETPAKTQQKSTMVEPRTGRESAAPPIDRRGKPKSAGRSQRWPYFVAAGLFVLLAGVGITLVIVRLQTKIGTVEIDINEPGAHVQIDGQHRITITDADTNENVRIEINEGQHEMKVTKGGFETYTTSFTVKKKENVLVKVTLLPAAPAKPIVPPPAIPPPAGADTARNPDPMLPPLLPAKPIDPPIIKKSRPLDRSYWLSIMPTEDQARDKDFARYRGAGVLEITSGPGANGFGTRESPYWAKDAAIRTLVKVGPDQEFYLVLRGTDRQENGYSFENYAVSFDGQSFKLSKWLVRGKKVEGETLKEVRAPKHYDDFFEFKFQAVGDVLTVEADGEEVIRVRDSSLDQGGVLSFKAVGQGGTTLVKKADIQIMDFTGGTPPEGTSYLPREQWIDVNPICCNSWPWDKNERGRSWKSVSNGILTLNNGACNLSSIQAKNISIKAMFKFTKGESDGNLALSIREGNKKSYYTSCNRKPDGTFVVWMNNQGIERRNVPRDFFELKVTAVADLITVHLNGEQVIEYRDPDLKMQRVGGAGINAWHCHGQIKDVQVMIKD